MRREGISISTDMTRGSGEAGRSLDESHDRAATTGSQQYRDVVVELPVASRRHRPRREADRDADAERTLVRTGSPAEQPWSQGELVAAEARVRDLAASVQLTQEELARARKKLEDERTRYAADAERFRTGLATVQASDDDLAALVAFNAAGVLVAANRRAAAVLGVHVATAGASCCSVFGCHRPETGLADTCITALARASGGWLSPVPVGEVEAGTQMWLRGVPLGSGGSLFVVDADDAPTESPMPAERAGSCSGLRIHMLGGTRIEIDGERVHGAWLAQRAGQLLGLLVVNRDRAVSGFEIAEALRSSSGAVSPGTVRSIVHELRDRLEPSRSRRAGSRFLLAGPTGYRLDPTALTVDVEQFEALARVGLSRKGHANDSETSVRALERAIELYKGELLADFRYAEWAFLERERLSLIAAECFRRLAEIHAAVGDLDHGIALLDRLVALDPLDGPSQRALIALCLRRGRYGRANRQYSLFRARLQREFGERPDFGLDELFADLA
jgi:DNA-binding SARP family transcriptional activator